MYLCVLIVDHYSVFLNSHSEKISVPCVDVYLNIWQQRNKSYIIFKVRRPTVSLLYTLLLPSLVL